MCRTVTCIRNSDDCYVPRFSDREFVDPWEQNGFGIGVVTKVDGEPPDPAWIQKLKNAG